MPLVGRGTLTAICCIVGGLAYYNVVCCVFILHIMLFGVRLVWFAASEPLPWLVFFCCLL